MQENTWVYIQVQLATTDPTNGFSYAANYSSFYSREEKVGESASTLARKMAATTICLNYSCSHMQFEITNQQKKYTTDSYACWIRPQLDFNGRDCDIVLKYPTILFPEKLSIWKWRSGWGHKIHLAKPYNIQTCRDILITFSYAVHT